MHIRLKTPDLTEELVRFLGRLGMPAREVDYGLVEVDSTVGVDEVHHAGCLRIWERVNARATVVLELAPAA